jgi:hypothetical protein
MNANRPGLRIVSTPRSLVCALAIAVAAAAMPTASYAEDRGSAEQREACTPDVLRLCMSSIYSVKAILACMAKNKDKLSNRCRSLLGPEVLG